MDFGTELADIKTKNDLTEEERKVVDNYVSQIDLNNTQLVIQYGAGAQKKIADFSEGALNNVRTKDMG
ncbi:MAG: toxic anion resistance protein, partial [Lachnospiraceae bacterium]|nr:toxic anion resistance protein [Lachnospiraceae bacterium]